jgi:hypothetical protein
MEHQKRMHPTYSLQIIERSSKSLSSMPEMVQILPNRVGVRSDPAHNSGTERAAEATRVDTVDLQAKIQELEAGKRSVDEDIMSIRRTLQLLSQ